MQNGIAKAELGKMLHLLENSVSSTGSATRVASNRAALFK